jgi:TatD DNase family protein
MRLVSAGITIRPRSSIFLVIPESMGYDEPTFPAVRWVDTHCHLQLDGRDPAGLLDRAPDVAWVVAPGVDLASSRASVDLARELPSRVLPTAGLHPHDATRFAGEWPGIEELAPQVAAIGETGLDRYRMHSPIEEQIESFRAHCLLAVELGKPLIVHCRDAFADVHALLEETGAAKVALLHSWTGGRKWTRRFLDLGVMFSYSGVVAFETGDTVRLGAELVPPERVVVETDTPYLAPPPHRGEKNEPAWVALVGAALARVWGMSEEEVARVTTVNAERIFRG